MKILKFEIKNCGDCPYCEYDSYYDRSKNSGYDCTKLGERLIEDVGSEVTPSHLIEIPSNCPLPDSKINDAKLSDMEIKLDAIYGGKI